MGEYVNSQQAQFSKSHSSCGILEVHHLPKNTIQTLFSLANAMYNKANQRPGAFVLFSDAADDSRGAALAALIKLNPQCGNLIETSKKANPRTGTIIKAWLLEVDHDAFRKWYQEELANRLDVN